MLYLGAKAEGRHTADFILEEGNGNISRESVIIAESVALEPGTVLGKVTADGTYMALDQDAETGIEVAAAVLYAAVDASGGDAEGVIVARHATLIGDQLIWPDDIDAGEKTTAIGQLAAHDLIVR